MDDTITYLGLLEDEEIPLDLAAFEIAALDHPEIALDSYLDTMATLEDAIDAMELDAPSPVEQAEALSSVIALDHGFAGDREHYDDSRNADLIAVIDRRRGLPVALCILYASVARRVGWTADILNIPGHVLMRLGSEAATVLIDPFNLGRIVTRAQLAHLLGQMSGDTTASAEDFAAMTNRMVLVRLLTNQAMRAEQAGDTARALTVFRRITVIAPAYGHGWWEQARLEQAASETAAARSSLSAMLEMTRDTQTRARIADALDNLASAP